MSGNDIEHPFFAKKCRRNPRKLVFFLALLAGSAISLLDTGELIRKLEASCLDMLVVTSYAAISKTTSNTTILA